MTVRVAGRVSWYAWPVRARRSPHVLWGLLLCTLFLPITSTRAQTLPRLTYLANMGVLLESGTTRVVIDGFHHGALAEYASLRPADRAALEGATGAFAELDAILVTHRHADHFQAASVAARLAVDTRVRVLAPREVLDSLIAHTPSLRGDRRLIEAVPGASTQVGTATVLTLDLPHNPTRTRRATNVGYLVQLGAVRVLHVGDADPDEGTMRRALVSMQPADVAIVPFWYLTGSPSSLLTTIGASRYVAAHLPPTDTVKVKRQLGAVRALATPGMVLTLAPNTSPTRPRRSGR